MLYLILRVFTKALVLFVLSLWLAVGMTDVIIEAIYSGIYEYWQLAGLVLLVLGLGYGLRLFEQYVLERIA